MQYFKYLSDYLPIVWKNSLLRYIVIALILSFIFATGKSYFPTDTVMAYFESSTMSQLKLILQQVERERDDYKNKTALLDAELATLSTQKDKIAKEKADLKYKITTLEKKLKDILEAVLIIPSKDKKELAKQFTDLGFKVTIKECD